MGHCRAGGRAGGRAGWRTGGRIQIKFHGSLHFSMYERIIPEMVQSNSHGLQEKQKELSNYVLTYNIS